MQHLFSCTLGVKSSEGFNLPLTSKALKRTQIIQNQTNHKTSILQMWYTHSSISHAHGNDKRAKISLGDGHTAEIEKFHL